MRLRRPGGLLPWQWRPHTIWVRHQVRGEGEEEGVEWDCRTISFEYERFDSRCLRPGRWFGWNFPGYHSWEEDNNRFWCYKTQAILLPQRRWGGWLVSYSPLHRLNGIWLNFWTIWLWLLLRIHWAFSICGCRRQWWAARWFRCSRRGRCSYQWHSASWAISAFRIGCKSR